MSVETLDPPVVNQEAQSQTIEAAASGSAQTLAPGYVGVWRKIWASPAYYWWAYRHYLNTGQVVVQLGTRTSPPRRGLIEIGLRKDFTVHSPGRHRFAFRMETGPITSIQGANPYAFGIVSGGRPHYFNLASGQTSYQFFTEDLAPGPYSVWVVGGVKTYPTHLRPYGEMIFTCPSISVYPLPFGLRETDPLDDRLNEIVPGQGSLKKAVAALAGEAPDEFIQIEDGLADLEEQMFSSFDVTEEN